MRGETTSNKKRRGFAAVSREVNHAIAVAGGKAVHRQGKGHEFTSEEARAAGKKGGRKVSENRTHMAWLGRMGGIKSAARRAAAKGGNAASK